MPTTGFELARGLASGLAMMLCVPKTSSTQFTQLAGTG
jgi:hypothetical protein